MCDEVENMHKEFMPHKKGMVLSKKSTYTILVAAELASFCGKPFLFERSTNRLWYSDASIWQTFPGK